MVMGVRCVGCEKGVENGVQATWDSMVLRANVA